MSYFFIPGLERDMYEERIRQAELYRQAKAARGDRPTAWSSFRTWLGNGMIAGGNALKGQAHVSQNSTWVPQRVRYSRQGQ